MQKETTLDAAVVEITDALMHQADQLREYFTRNKAPSATSYEDAKMVLNELAEYALASMTLFADTVKFLDAPPPVGSKRRSSKRGTAKRKK